MTRPAVLTFVQETIQFSRHVHTRIGQTHLIRILTLLVGTADDLITELPAETQRTTTDAVRTGRRFQTGAVVATRARRTEREIEILRTVRARIAVGANTSIRLRLTLVDTNAVVF